MVHDEHLDCPSPGERLLLLSQEPASANVGDRLKCFAQQEYTKFSQNNVGMNERKN
jgi:hypothetical protein